jgi:threonine dehydratase
LVLTAAAAAAAAAPCALQVGAESFRLCRDLLDGVLLVDNAAISAAIKDVFNETRSILEPAGAVGVAGAKAWLKHNGHQVKGVRFRDNA